MWLGKKSLLAVSAGMKLAGELGVDQEQNKEFEADKSGK